MDGVHKIKGYFDSFFIFSRKHSSCAVLIPFFFIFMILATLAKGFL